MMLLNGGDALILPGSPAIKRKITWKKKDCYAAVQNHNRQKDRQKNEKARVFLKIGSGEL